MDAPSSSMILLYSLPFLLTLCLTTVIGATVLERRFTIEPNALRQASEREKWLMAARIMTLYTIFLPVVGLLSIALSLLEPERFNSAIQLLLFWAVALPVSIPLKKWNFEWQLRQYRYFDKQIKLGKQPFALFLRFPWLARLLPEKFREFSERGFNESSATPDHPNRPTSDYHPS